MRLHTLKTTLLSFILAAPTLAMAHAGHESLSSFMSGFVHPIGGLDHMIAMVAIGLWAAHLGGKAQFTLPLAFITTMLAGGVIAMFGFTVPFIEVGILLSIILVGALLAASKQLPISLCAGIAGLFALFHGAAHGAEMPIDMNGAQYSLGFILATAALNAVGLGIGKVVTHFQIPSLYRIIGALISLAGIGLALA